MGKKSGLFEKWFKNFTVTVFMQSFHAAMLMFIMFFLSRLQDASGVMGSNDFLIGIISIVGMMAIIKFEKLFRDLFGFDSSMAGDIKTSGAKLFAGAKSAMDLKNNVQEGFQKTRKLSKDLKKTDSTLAKKRASYEAEFGPLPDSGGTAGAASGAKSTTGPRTKLATEATNNYNSTVASATSTTGTAGAAGVAGGNTPYGRDTESIMYRERQERKLQEIEDLESKRNDQKHELISQSKQRFIDLAGTVTSLSIAAGAVDEMAEVLTVGNIINKGVNEVTRNYTDRAADKQMYDETGKEKYKREKLTVKKAIKQSFDVIVDSQVEINQHTVPGRVANKVINRQPKSVDEL